MTRIAGHLLVECLLAQGVTHAFGVPGESYLAVLDGVTLADLVPPVTAPATGAKPLRFMPGIPEPS